MAALLPELGEGIVNFLFSPFRHGERGGHLVASVDGGGRRGGGGEASFNSDNKGRKKTRTTTRKKTITRERKSLLLAPSLLQTEREGKPGGSSDISGDAFEI